jgi:transcriptional regulator with XRE-family HTH domain
MIFSEKLRLARECKGISQQELGDRVGLSRRSINAYENEGILPRARALRAVAKALDVSMEYLVNENIDDPQYGRQREAQIEAVRERFGERGAKEAQRLLTQNAAFFAGGAMPQEDKDAFFEAIMAAYLACKQEARQRYGREPAVQPDPVIAR